MALWCRSVHPGCTRHQLRHASRLKRLEFLCSWFKPLFFHHLCLSFPAFLFSCYSAQMMIVIQFVEGLEMWKDSMEILFFSSKYWRKDEQPHGFSYKKFTTGILLVPSLRSDFDLSLLVGSFPGGSMPEPTDLQIHYFEQFWWLKNSGGRAVYTQPFILSLACTAMYNLQYNSSKKLS